jgi:hypothetical protein
MILYLHGFRSSPHSFKARMLAERLHALGRGPEYLCPQLPPSPAAAIALAQSLIAGQAPEQLTLIGSSLGGYYATWLAEQTGCRAVLLNPAVAPPQDLAKYVGVTTDWHSGAPFEFKAGYIDELHALAVPRISRPERYFLVAATGDEVLDWRDMAAHYAPARQLIVQGSDHSLSDFASQIAAVLAFCDARPETPA